MRTEGSLAESDFPSLVQTLSEKRWTGTLTLTHAGAGTSVSIQDGRMVFAASSSPDDRMGPLLLRRGRITLKQMEAAAEQIAPGKRFGAVLVEQGVLSPKQLIAAVVEHTQEILYGAFQWTEGHYRLQAGPLPAESVTLRMSTPDIILEGIRRIESWTRVNAAVGGLRATYDRAPGAEALAAAIRLPPERAALLQRLEGPLSVGELSGDAALPDFDLCRTLWAFRVIGLVRRLDAAAPAPQMEDESLGIVVPEE